MYFLMLTFYYKYIHTHTHRSWPKRLFINSCFNILNLGKKIKTSFILFQANQVWIRILINNKHFKTPLLKRKILYFVDLSLNCAPYNYAVEFKILVLNSLTMQIICQHLEVKQGERGETLHIPGLISKHQMETILQWKKEIC